MAKARRNAQPARSTSTHFFSRVILIRAAVVIAVALAVVGGAWWKSRETGKAPGGASSPKGTWERLRELPPLLEPQEKVFAKYAGSESCRACHAEVFAAWKVSNHGMAER